MFCFFLFFFFFFLKMQLVFFGAVRNKLQTKKYLLELIKRRSKVYEKNMSCGHALNLNYKKLFPKTINQWEFHYGMFAKLPRILLLATFCTAQTHKIILTLSCQKLPCQLNSRAVFRQSNAIDDLGAQTRFEQEKKIEKHLFLFL